MNKLSYEEMIAKLTDASYQIGRFTDGCDRLQSAEESVEAVIAALREAALAQQAQPPDIGAFCGACLHPKRDHIGEECHHYDGTSVICNKCPQKAQPLTDDEFDEWAKRETVERHPNGGIAAVEFNQGLHAARDRMAQQAQLGSFDHGFAEGKEPVTHSVRLN